MDASLIEKLRKFVLNGAVLLCGMTTALRAALEMFYFDSPRHPDPATSQIVPYVVRNATIYITEHLADVFSWLHWSFYFFGAVVVLSVVLDLVWSSRSNKGPS
jgi:hypothetical protein